MLKNKTIIIGVTGCIAAYKSAELVSRLKKMGADVWVVLTPHGEKFVGPLTFRTLSNNPVITDLFDEKFSNMPVPHIALTQKADLVAVVPATANALAKAANGIADDALSTMLLSCTCAKLFAPAMNTAMWDNPLTKENIKKLKSVGAQFVGPDTGRLACGDEGEGRLIEIDKIFKKIIEMLGVKQDLKNKKILITAGGTREAIDPVRYIGNRSSGKMGYALAEAAKLRGAEVRLVSGPSSLNPPAGVSPIYVENTKDMQEAVQNNFKDSDVLIMNAACADFAPALVSTKKIKKLALSKVEGGKTRSLKLKDNPDILQGLKKYNSKQKIIGFALETDNALVNAKNKLKDKDLDLIILNGIETIGSSNIKASFIYRSKKHEDLPELSKQELANRILDRLLCM